MYENLIYILIFNVKNECKVVFVNTIRSRSFAFCLFVIFCELSAHEFISIFFMFWLAPFVFQPESLTLIHLRFLSLESVRRDLRMKSARITE